MGKILFWFLVIMCALFAARLIVHRSQKNDAPKPIPKPRGAAKVAGGKVETMVQCAHCGIHLPRSEALLVQGRTWCSQEHADLGLGIQQRNSRS